MLKVLTLLKLAASSYSLTFAILIFPEVRNHPVALTRGSLHIRRSPSSRALRLAVSPVPNPGVPFSAQGVSCVPFGPSPHPLRVSIPCGPESDYPGFGPFVFLTKFLPLVVSPLGSAFFFGSWHSFTRCSSPPPTPPPISFLPPFRSPAF